MVSAISQYRDLLREERTAIAGLCDKWQSVLNDNDKELSIPEDMCGKIQIAIGQARLLMKKKFEQFGGLISASEEGSSGKEITVQDLQGFWEMMYIQVADINKKFEEIENLKENNWEPIPSQENQRKPLQNLNKSTRNAAPCHKPFGVTKDFSAVARERLAEAKALARKRMKKQSCQ